MLRYLIVLVVGLLLGANVAYFYATGNSRACAAAAVAAAPAIPTPAAPASLPAASQAPVSPTGPQAPPAAGNAAPSPKATTAPASFTPTPGGLIIPVAGVTADKLVDTYTQSRSAGRVHEAIDIMAPAGTPVLAAVDGPLVKLFTSALGGLTIYQFDRDAHRVYYYAHLQSYAPGISEGQVLRQGQLIGYVGSSGDANPAAPHLHFSVGDLTDEKKWWKSTVTNPYPLLVNAPTR